MRWLDLTLPTAAENLALDEACLEEADAAAQPRETLRLWEPATPLVVVGRGSRVGAETRAEPCRADGVPILRRASGGAAIVAGPGCLMYAVVLSLDSRPKLRLIDAAHDFVLGTIAAALAPLALGVERQGTSDLALREPPGPPRKFSGNSLRCKRRALLYHGTLLYDFPLELVARYLAIPPRRPAYRADRPHEDFIVNLPASASMLRQALRQAWNAEPTNDGWPNERVVQLVQEKYALADWNLRL